MSLKPRVIRDKILGVLYRNGFELRTIEEITEAGNLQGESVVSEAVHLLRKGLMDTESGPVPDKIPPKTLEEYVRDPRHRYSISVSGREFIERKGGVKAGAPPRRGLQPVKVKPSLKEARSWLSRATTALARADSLNKDKDSPGSVSSSQKAIEVSLKALFPAAGLSIPETHDVSGSSTAIIERISGDDESVRLATRKASRLAVLNEISAPLHEVSEYGFLGIAEKELITSLDAEIWHGYASEAVSLAKEVLAMFKDGRIRSG